MAATLAMIRSGHRHDFDSYKVSPESRVQLVAGEGCDPITQSSAAGIPIDGLKPRHAFTIPDDGFVLLRRTPQARRATVCSIADPILAHCSRRGRAVACHPHTH